MTDAGWAACAECGMVCNAGEYHPYAACLMFKQCRNSETVRTNLKAVRSDTYHQGRVAGLVAVKDYLETRAEIVEGSALREVLAGNHVKESNERSALAEIHAMQSVIRELEQQAQGAALQRGRGGKG